MALKVCLGLHNLRRSSSIISKSLCGNAWKMPSQSPLAPISKERHSTRMTISILNVGNIHEYFLEYGTINPTFE